MLLRGVLLVLLQAALLVSAQQDNVRGCNFAESAKGLKDGVLNRLLDSVDEDPNQIREKLRTALTTGDFNSQNIEMSSLITFMKPWFYRAVDLGKFFMMGKEKLQNFMSYAGSSVNEPFKDMVTMCRDSEVPVSEAPAKYLAYLNSGAETRQEGPSFDVSKGVTKGAIVRGMLKDPEDWTRDDVKTNLKQFLFRMPIEMLLESNIQAKKEIVRQIKMCIKGSDSGENKSPSCPSANEIIGKSPSPRGLATKSLMMELYQDDEIYGDFEDWTESTITETGLNTNQFPLEVVVEWDAAIIKSKMTEIVNMFGNDENLYNKYGRQLVEKLMEADKVKDMTTATQLDEFIRGMRAELRPYIYATDIDPRAISSSTQTTFNDNAKNAVIKKQLNKMERRNIATRFRAKEGAMTSTEIQTSLPLISLVDPKNMRKIVDSTNVISSAQLRDVVKYKCENGGGDINGYMLATMPKMLTQYRSGSSASVSNYPICMLKFFNTPTIMALSNNDGYLFLETGVPFSPTAGALLINMIQRPAIGASPDGRAIMPYMMVRNVGQDNREALCEKLPSTSAMCLFALQDAEISKAPQITKFMIQRDTKYHTVLLGDAAMKVDMADIVDILRIMRNSVPTREFCARLKKRYVEMSSDDKMIYNDEEVFLTFQPVELEQMPLCFCAAFGPHLISRLNPIAKEVLYNKIIDLGDLVYKTTGIPLDSATAIVTEGLRAMNIDQLTLNEINDLGTLSLLAPPDLIREMADSAIPVFLTMANELAMTPLFPCIDIGRINAIAQLIVKDRGPEVSQMDILQPVACLLWMLPESTLYAIDEFALTATSCEMKNIIQWQALTEAMKGGCMATGMYQYMMDRRRAVRQIQENAFKRTLQVPYEPPGGRRKRAATDLTMCDRASISGLIDVSSGEISGSSTVDFNSCMNQMCGRPIPPERRGEFRDKSRAVVNKLLNSNSIGSIDRQKLVDLNYCVFGLDVEQIKNLPTLRYSDFNGFIALLGGIGMEDKMLDHDQKEAYITKIKTDWKTPISSWSYEEILYVGQLLCHLKPEDINQLNKDNFGEVLPVVAMFRCPSTDVTMAMMNKAIQAAGEPRTWTAPFVAQLGNLLSVIKPEQLSVIPAAATAGLQPDAIRQISPDSMASLSLAQISNLLGATAASVSEQQMSKFSAEMKSALQLSLEGFHGRGSGNAASVALISLASVLVLAYRW